MACPTPVENIFCVPTDKFGTLFPLPDKGFRANITNYLSFFEQHGVYMPRTEELEKDENYKQIIPYIVLHHYDHRTSLHRLFTYRRHKGGEARLNDKISIGIGGHINECDVIPGLTRLHSAMERELAEEIEFPVEIRKSTYAYGLIYDPSNEVGRVHLGVVFIVELDKPEAYPREACIADPKWQYINALRRSEEPMENWTRITLNNLGWR